MKCIPLAITAAVMSAGCGLAPFGPSIQGSGKADSRVLSVGTGKALPEFTKVVANGSFEVDLKQGPQSDLEITGDDNIITALECEVKGDTLYVGVKGSYSTKLPLRLKVVCPKVEGVEVNGSGDVLISNLSGNSLDLEINGSGDIVANGRITELSIDISGSGDVDTTALESERAVVDVAGSGTVRVFATKSLTADVAGSGDIRYKGSPKIDKDIAGSGEVSPL